MWTEIGGRMKEFYINHVHFWAGNGKEQWSIAIDNNSISDYSEIILGRKPDNNIEKDAIRGAILFNAFSKIFNNNWRRRHGLKMIKRDRK